MKCERRAQITNFSLPFFHLRVFVFTLPSYPFFFFFPTSLFPPFFLLFFLLFLPFSLVCVLSIFLQSVETLVTPLSSAATSAFFARDLSRVAAPSKFAFSLANLIIPPGNYLKFSTVWILHERRTDGKGESVPEQRFTFVTPNCMQWNI